MAIERAETAGEPGYALLIAAEPGGKQGKQRVMDSGAALPALAAVSPAVLVGTPSGASVVQLVDPADPQTVLTHLRTAAAHRGPVLVYLAGQLTLDTKQRLPHLALARTAPRTVRYSALPWHWLAAELGHRPPGSTTLVVDLVADGTVWPLLAEYGSSAAHHLAAGLTLYGVVAPVPPKRQLAVPLYSRAFAALLRGAGERPPLGALHERAALEAGLGGGAELLLGGVERGEPSLPADGVAGGLPSISPRTGQPPIPASAPASPAPELPVGGSGANRDVSSCGAATAPFAGWADDSRAFCGERPGTPPSAVVPPPAFAPPVAATAAPAASVSMPDPHAAILEAARAGRHSEAAAMAAAWEQEAMRATGPSSPETIHWLEVRADLSRLADDPARACELWMAAARIRLGNQESPSHPDVEGAADRAHHQWQQIQDPVRAVALAPTLIELRTRVPGRRPGAVAAVRRRAELLVAPKAG